MRLWATLMATDSTLAKEKRGWSGGGHLGEGGAKDDGVEVKREGLLRTRGIWGAELGVEKEAV